MATKYLAAEEFAAWITPAVALGRITDAVENQYTAMSLIHQRLKDGLLDACAAVIVFGWELPERAKVRRWVFPFTYWQHVSGGSQGSYWNTASAEFHIQHQRTVSCHGLRFDPAGIDAMLADISAIAQDENSNSIEPKTPPTATDPGPLGWRETARRPHKEFWDGLLIGVIAMIWNGDLKPKNQEQIAKAMLDLAVRRGWKVGETAVKKPARQIFDAFRE